MRAQRRRGPRRGLGHWPRSGAPPRRWFRPVPSRRCRGSARGKSTSLVIGRTPQANSTSGWRICSTASSPASVPSANSAPVASNSGRLGRTTSPRASVPRSSRPCSIRSSRSRGGKRPPPCSPRSIAGVPQKTERRSCNSDTLRRSCSAICSIVSVSEGCSGSARTRPRSMSLTSGLNPPWAKLPRAYAATRRSRRALRKEDAASTSTASAASLPAGSAIRRQSTVACFLVGLLREESAPMSFVSRGFHRRRAEPQQEGRVPPGQYVTSDFPVLSAGPTPHRPLESWSFSIDGEIDEPLRWSWDEFRALRQRDGHERHPLRDEVVEARHDVGGRLGRYIAGGRGDERRVRGRRLRRRLHDEPAAGGRDGRQGVGGVRVRRRRSSPSTAAPRDCSSRTSTSGRARSGCAGCELRAEDEPGFWEGSATTTTAIHGASSATRATELAARRRRRLGRRDAAGQDDHARRSRLARAPRRSARRHEAHRRGRLSGAAQLLDRVRARGRARSR